MKKQITCTAILSAAMVLTGCAGGSGDGQTDTKGGEKTAKIGIVQFAEHPALDASYEGFVDTMKEAGYSEDSFDYKNAQGDQSNCTTIAQTFVNDGDDLIYAIATPAAQAAANETSDIPIVVSAVTDPAASGLAESNDKPGGNVTGASDLTPVESQIGLLKEALPDAKKIAIMYCNAEDNSRIQAELAEKACEKEGLEYQVATVTDSNQIQQVTESLIGKVDAIYVPTDNLLAEGMSTLSKVATEHKIPTIVGEEGMVTSGGLMTNGIDYYELGVLAANQAIEILENGSDPADMAIAYYPDDKCTLIVNQATLDRLGIELPASLKDKAEFITEEE